MKVLGDINVSGANPNEKWKAFTKSHALGDVVTCKVTRIEPSGIYTDIGGIEGVIHPSQTDGMNMAFKARGLHVGQNINAKIVGMSDSDGAGQGKVSLSITAMLDSSVNPGSTGEDFGGTAPSSAESDGEAFGATEASHKQPPRF